MKTCIHVLLLILLISACNPDDLAKKNSTKDDSAVTTQAPLDQYITAVQQTNKPAELSKSTDELFKQTTTLQVLSQGSLEEINHLKNAFIGATKTLIEPDKQIKRTKQERCQDFEADIWWDVFWYMQSRPAIKMQEADLRAKEISTWAYTACSCSLKIEQ